MTTNQLLQKHQRCIKVLGAIETLEKRIASNEAFLNGFAGTFPEVRASYEQRIDTQRKSAIRLQNIYQSLSN